MRDGRAALGPKPAHLTPLDGVRGYGMALVLISHLPSPSDVPWAAGLWKFEHALRLGYISLDAFFVMSGFLITRLLLAERRRTGKIDLRAFYLRRVLRIFPIYYLTLAAVMVAVPPSADRALSLLLYGYNFYLPFHPTPNPLEQSWSLAVEEQFYMLWPLLLIVLPRRWLTPTTSLILPLIASGTALGYSVVSPPTLAAELIYTTLPTRMLPLALGCYLAVREDAGTTLAPSQAILPALVGVVTLAAAAAARAEGVLPAGGWYWSVALPGFSLVAFGLIAAITGPTAPRWLTAPLSIRPARFLGRISYAVYLFHVPILFALGINAASLEDGPAPIKWSMLAVALSVAAAMASWYLIERPLIRLKLLVAEPATPTRAAAALRLRSAAQGGHAEQPGAEQREARRLRHVQGALHPGRP